MLLTVDIGNTSIKFGTFDGPALVSKFVVPTHREYTNEQIAKAVDGRLDGSLDAAIVSSVVPPIDESVSRYLDRVVGASPRFVRTSDDFGLTFNFPIHEAGSDRLVNSFAAAEKYGAPVIIIAFGTATVFDVVDANREHRGGLIAPGPATTAKALQIAASKLPEVEIAEPTNVLNTTTIGSIQAGIFYSQIGLVEAAVRHIKAEIGEAKVISTGGFAHLIADKCKEVDAVDADLTLEGLRLLHERWQRN